MSWQQGHLFQHSSFVKFPCAARGGQGEEARGVSVYLHSSRIAGLHKKVIRVTKAENCFLLTPEQLSMVPAKLWALPLACFHQQHPASAAHKANHKQISTGSP